MFSLTRNLDKARDAYDKKDIEISKKAHQPLDSHGEGHKNPGNALRGAVYGGLDGIIHSYAMIMGSAGAVLTASVIVTIGLSNLISGAMSMGLGDFLSSKSENEYIQRERKREEWEVLNDPEGEKREIVEIYKAKGVSEEDSIDIANIVSKSPKAWVDIMMIEELGLSGGEASPLVGAFATFISFIIFGIIPLIPFIVVKIAGTEGDYLFLICSLMTAFAAFTLGVLKTIIAKKNWFIAGMETLFLAAICAIAAFIIGLILAPIA